MRTTLLALLTVAMLALGVQAAEAKADYTVTASVSTTTTSTTGSFVLSGRVSPRAAGAKVAIQRRYGQGSWTTIDTDRLSSTSTYSLRIRPTRGGPTSYRVTKAGAQGRGGDVSATRVVDVYRWRHLADLARITPGDVTIGTWRIKNSPFVRSISIYGNPPQWDISAPRCTRIRTFIGVDDDSPAGTTADTKIILDFATDDQLTIAETPLGALAWGQYPQYVQESFPPGHTDVILVGGADTHEAPGTGYLTYGTPQVYCNS